MKFKLKSTLHFIILHSILLFVALALGIALIVGDVLCYNNAQAITNLLCGTGVRFEGEDVELAAAAGDKLVQNVCDEGIIMLKNSGGTDGKGILPLAQDNRKLNLFGWASVDNGFLLTGIGSGSARIQNETKVTLSQGLKKQGFELNNTNLYAY